MPLRIVGREPEPSRVGPVPRGGAELGPWSPSRGGREKGRYSEGPEPPPGVGQPLELRNSQLSSLAERLWASCKIPQSLFFRLLNGHHNRVYLGLVRNKRDGAQPSPPHSKCSTNISCARSAQTFTGMPQQWAQRDWPSLPAWTSEAFPPWSPLSHSFLLLPQPTCCELFHWPCPYDPVFMAT